MNNSHEQNPQFNLEYWAKILPNRIANNLRRIKNYYAPQVSEGEEVLSPITEKEITELIATTKRDLRNWHTLREGKTTNITQTIEHQALNEIGEYLDFLIQNKDIGNTFLDITLSRYQLADLAAYIEANPHKAPLLRMMIENMPPVRDQEELQKGLRELKQVRPDLIEYIASVLKITPNEVSSKVQIKDAEILKMLHRINLWASRKHSEEDFEEDPDNE